MGRGETVFENDNYFVTTGESSMIEDYVVYVAINKRTGIVEAEDPMMPKIVDYAIQLDKAIFDMGEDGVELFPDTRTAH